MKKVDFPDAVSLVKLTEGRDLIRKKRTPPKGWRPPPPKETTPLNPAQKKFVSYVAEGMPQTAAARAAGYSHPGRLAYQLMKKPNIKLALIKEREAYAQASQMTKKKVLDGFLDAIAQAKTLADPTAQIQGWNSVAKLCGYFEPTKHRIEVDIKGKIVLEKLQTLSDEQLLLLADGNTDIIEGEFVSEGDDLPALPNRTGTHDEG